MKKHKVTSDLIRHCAGRSDEAISKPSVWMRRDCTTALALMASTHKSAAPKKHMLAKMVLALGFTALAQPASAAVVTFNWSGMMTMLDPTGAVLGNTSMSSKLNNAQTPISGTLTLDTATRAGSATMAPFYYFGNPFPMHTNGFHIQSAGGNLLMANILINWGGANGFPVSVVLDASGLFAALPTSQSVGATISGVGVRPASDGTYVSASDSNYAYTSHSGYLNLGAVPIATTKWNTTPLCPPGGGNASACMNAIPSGDLPLIADTATNVNDFNAPFMGGDGSNDPGIGGSPLLAGPFESYSMNFDFTSLTVTSVTAVPVPAAAWLLGSGLAGLVSAVRRRRA